MHLCIRCICFMFKLGYLPYGPAAVTLELDDNNVMVIGVNVHPPHTLQSIIISYVCIYAVEAACIINISLQ